MVGFGSFGDFRAYPGYRFTVEHSVYTAGKRPPGGVASALIAALIERAQGLGKHTMIGGIASDNLASLALHAKLGFTETARMPRSASNFGRWLDLVFMQKTL